MSEIGGKRTRYQFILPGKKVYVLEVLAFNISSGVALILITCQQLFKCQIRPQIFAREMKLVILFFKTGNARRERKARLIKKLSYKRLVLIGIRSYQIIRYIYNDLHWTNCKDTVCIWIGLWIGYSQPLEAWLHHMNDCIYISLQHLKSL